MMDNSHYEIFLDSFIKTFLTKTVKRRTYNNRLERVTDIFNRVLLNYLKTDYRYSEKQVANALVSNGFTLMDNYNVEFDHFKWKEGDVLHIGKFQFVNIKAQELKDIKLTTWHSFPDNVKKSTLDRIELLRNQIKNLASESVISD